MSNDDVFLKEADLERFIALVRKGKLFGTTQRNDQSAYEKFTSEKNAEQQNSICLKIAPPIESIKEFLFPAKEQVAVYPAKPQQQSGQQDEQDEQTIVGARACDVCALNILDKIFLEQDAADPFYQKRRDNTLLITTDCIEPKQSCFCNLFGEKPYADSGFDLNLAPIMAGYIVTAGSEKGKQAVQKAGSLLTAPTAEQIAERQQKREKTLEKLKEINEHFTPKAALDKLAMNQPQEKWTELAANCLECGACNFVCPTCHCFLLYDQPSSKSEGQNERKKTWDSCLMANFAKMAGVGGIKPTPRPELRSRFENRLRHKFEWMPQNLKLLGCVGCGRCIDACMDGSDLRDIIKEFGQ